jgi:hypothetical protein
MAAIPTGNVRRSWQIADLSELAFHLMGRPVEIGLVAAVTNTDRKVVVVRDDGQMVVMSYRRSETVSGWTRWQTQGAWRSAVTANGALYMVARRVIAGVTTYRLETMEPGLVSDGTVTIANQTVAIPLYAGQAMSVWHGSYYLGDFPVDGAGHLTGLSGYEATPLNVGFNAPIEVELVPPIDGAEGLRHKVRICRVEIEAINSGPMRCNGFESSGYGAEAGVGGEPVLVSGTRRFRTLGRSRTGTATITQDYAGPFEIRSITMEVTS